jgi:hypothetical protein
MTQAMVAAIAPAAARAGWTVPAAVVCASVLVIRILVICRRPYVIRPYPLNVLMGVRTVHKNLAISIQQAFAKGQPFHMV